KEFHFSHFDCSNLKANRVNGNQQPLLLGNRHKIIYRQSFSDFKLNIKLLVERHRDNNSALTFEEVFLSINLNLIQMLEFEYIFLSEFFKISSDNALNLIKNLFSETINLFLNTNMEAIELCGDVTALLISSNLIRILPTKIYHKIVNKLLIAYWRELEKLIWFQIKELLSLHITSLKNARYKSMSVKKAEISPITRRYGEFTSSVIFITNTMTFSTLQRDMIRNWFHLSFKNFNNIIINIAEYSFTKNQEILAYVYRICNIGMLRNTLRSVCGTDLGQPGFYEVVFVNEMFQNTVEVYSHFILTESIGYVLKFVDANESIASPTIPEDIRQKLRDINLKFKNDWDKILKGLKIKVLSRFSENDLSRDVMNNVFDSFLNYYHRLHKIVDKIQDETLNPVPMLHQMILEVKRIKSDMK
ncbi:MAG: Vacuolar protein sorting-associated protein 52, partial [Marteilia pararefringens]